MLSISIDPVHIYYENGLYMDIAYEKYLWEKVSFGYAFEYNNGKAQTYVNSVLLYTNPYHYYYLKFKPRYYAIQTNGKKFNGLYIGPGINISYGKKPQVEGKEYGFGLGGFLGYNFLIANKFIVGFEGYRCSTFRKKIYKRSFDYCIIYLKRSCAFE